MRSADDRRLGRGSDPIHRGKTNSCPGEFPDNRSRAPAFWRIANESVASKSCWSTPAARTGARRTTVPGRSRKARSTRRKIQSRPPAASSPKNSSGGLDRPVAGLGRGPPARRQTRDRLLRRGRFRHNVASQQFLRDRVAALERPDRRLSGGRSRRLVRSEYRPIEDPVGQSELLHQLEKIVP